jgi:MFS family permease
MRIRPEHRRAPCVPVSFRARRKCALGGTFLPFSPLDENLIYLFFAQIGGGVLGDIWDAEERGQALAIYSLAPLLGPVIGPMCGAFIAEKSTWRWVVR